MSIVDKEIVDYICGVQPYCSGLLGEIQREALEKSVPIVPPETARFLSTLLSIVKPEKILEIGCAIGFSSALMSRYITPNGHITTIDRFDVMIQQAKENFKKLGIEDKVTLLEGDACEIVPTLEEKYDVVFMDAAKGQYLQLFPECLKRLQVGGLLIADDVLQEGRIAKGRFDIPRRQRTIHTRMRTFLFAATNTDGLESSILPIGDGILLVKKLREINIEEINYGNVEKA